MGVMAWAYPGPTSYFWTKPKNVDARDKRGHDGACLTAVNKRTFSNRCPG
jgi:hypothetical protein